VDGPDGGFGVPSPSSSPSAARVQGAAGARGDAGFARAVEPSGVPEMGTVGTVGTVIPGSWTVAWVVRGRGVGRVGG
jgi:hypothetical protein